LKKGIVSGDERDRELDQQPHAPARTLNRLPRHLEIVVVETDSAVDQRDDQHHPDIDVVQIAPKQRRHGHAGEDHQPAHGRCALLGDQMPLRPVGADRLALALADAQGADDLRAEEEHEQERRQHGAAGAEGNVSKHIEDAEFARELAQPIEHVLPPSGCIFPGEAALGLYGESAQDGIGDFGPRAPRLNFGLRSLQNLASIMT
jgi:hypothetical protein